MYNLVHSAFFPAGRIQPGFVGVTWAKKELVTSGMVAEISLHHPVSGTDPHVHILTTMRKIDGEKFSTKKPRERNDKALLCKQRATWAEIVNAALEKAGRTEREPQPKIGQAAAAMKPDSSTGVWSRFDAEHVHVQFSLTQAAFESAHSFYSLACFCRNTLPARNPKRKIPGAGRRVNVERRGQQGEQYIDAPPGDLPWKPDSRGLMNDLAFHEKFQ